MARAILVGRSGSPGIGVGRLLPVAQPSARDRTNGNGAGAAKPDRAVEERRLREALERAAADLEALARSTAAVAGDEVGEIFEAQALFARDPALVEPALALIRSGSAAEGAIEASAAAQADALASVDDPFFRERAADLRDVGRRVVGLLEGRAGIDLWHPDGSPAIVCAADLEPSAVATLRRELVAGLALSGGAPTGHAAIVARALGIPLVLGLGEQLATVEVGVRAAVDGDRGLLLLEPVAGDLEVATPAATGRAVVEPGADRLPVQVAANVGSAHEAELAAQAGATAIGLVRTELLFLGRSAPPSVGEQTAAYRRILAAFRSGPDRPVTFRTLDVGGDKPAAWQASTPEPNPALGVRGLRLGLARPEMLDDQLAALVAAARGEMLGVMLPMVAVPAEVAAVRARLERLAGPAPVRLGAMIEIPAAAIVADGVAAVADFLSIGTNDLVQYTLAADRTNAALAELASPLQPAVLRLIRSVVEAARQWGRHVAVCGEAAADPEMIPLLVGLGVDELSVAPGSVRAVRRIAAGLDVDASRRLAVAAVAATSIEEVRALVR
jgi:phosphoenolpyruvate-protein phosphotransferase